MKSVWNEIRRIQESIDEMFESFFKKSPFGSERLLSSPFEVPAIAFNDFETPLMDAWETEKEIKAEIDLPGVDKKDIKLNISKGMLEIKAEKKHEKKESRNGFHRIERAYRGFYRKISLPESADIDRAEAKYENGVLKISIPKKELPEFKTKQIEVK
jgi:HSP20 family protein